MRFLSALPSSTSCTLGSPTASWVQRFSSTRCRKTLRFLRFGFCPRRHHSYKGRNGFPDLWICTSLDLHILRTGKESVMRRWSVPIIAVIFSGAMTYAQQPPSTHDQLLSSDLIAWSFMQEPQPEQNQSHQTPTPDPHPETQPAQSPTPSQPDQPAQPRSSPTSGSQGQAPTA